MTPSELEQRDKARELVLRAVHDLTKGDEYTMIDDAEVIGETKLSPDDCDAALVYLENQGLVLNRSMNGSYSLTHRGLLAYERLHRPAPPAQVPQIVQNFHSSVGAVQTGNNNTAQVLQQAGANISEIIDLVSALRAQADSLPSEIRQEALEQVDNLKEELQTTKKPARVKAALLALWHGTKAVVAFAPKVLALAEKLGLKLPPG